MASGRESRPEPTRRKRRNRPGKRYFRTTREGKAFIGVTLGVGLAAINTGNNLLFLIFGFMMSLIVLSGIMSEIVLRGVKVSRRLPDRVFAQGTCLVELALENKKDRAPSYSLEVEDLAEGLPTERRCYFLKVAAGSEQVAGYRRQPARRGYLQLTGFRIATRYPFGIIEKWRLLDAPAELLVYPRLLDRGLAELEPRSYGTEAPTTKLGVGTEVAGLRNYNPEDEARSIHWRRSASLGRLVVLEKQRDASTHLTLVLDNARPESAGEEWAEGFEHAVSEAATLAVAAAGRDLSVEVVCRGSRSPVVMPGSAADPLLRYLALLDSVAEANAEPFGRFKRSSRVVHVAVTPRAREAA